MVFLHDWIKIMFYFNETVTKSCLYKSVLCSKQNADYLRQEYFVWAMQDVCICKPTWMTSVVAAHKQALFQSLRNPKFIFGTKGGWLPQGNWGRGFTYVQTPLSLSARHGRWLFRMCTNISFTRIFVRVFLSTNNASGRLWSSHSYLHWYVAGWV